MFVEVSCVVITFTMLITNYVILYQDISINFFTSFNFVHLETTAVDGENVLVISNYRSW
jgi:hypothetical protein